MTKKTTKVPKQPQAPKPIEHTMPLGPTPAFPPGSFPKNPRW